MNTTGPHSAARAWWQSRSVYPAAIVFVGAYGAVTWLWYARFLAGNAPGPYWALSAFSKTPFPLIVLLVVIVPVIITFTGLLRANKNQSGTGRLLYPLTASLLAGVLIIPASLPALTNSLSHLETMEVSGHTLHLARADTLVNVSFALVECDGSALWCEQRYRTDNFTLSTAHLEIDSRSGEVLIVVCEDYTSTPDCESIPTYRP